MRWLMEGICVVFLFHNSLVIETLYGGAFSTSMDCSFIISAVFDGFYRAALYKSVIENFKKILWDKVLLSGTNLQWTNRITKKKPWTSTWCLSSVGIVFFLACFSLTIAMIFNFVIFQTHRPISFSQLWCALEMSD